MDEKNLPGGGEVDEKGELWGRRQGEKNGTRIVTSYLSAVASVTCAIGEEKDRTGRFGF